MGSGLSVLTNGPCARCRTERDTQVTDVGYGVVEWCLVCGKRTGYMLPVWPLVPDFEPYRQASA